MVANQLKVIMQSNLKLSNNSGEFLSDPTSYRILMCEAFMSDTY